VRGFVLKAGNPKSSSRGKKSGPVVRFTNYFYGSRSLAFSLLAVLPLLLAYEILALKLNQNSTIEIRNYADIFFYEVLEDFGFHGFFTLAIIVIAFLLYGLLFRKNDRYPIKFHYIIGVLVESSIYAVLLGYTISAVLNKLALSAPISESKSLEIMLSVGAGIYEELVFRAFLFGMTGYTLNKILGINVWVSYLFASVISSAAFSWFHYLNGIPFDVASAAYRFLAGLFFCLLFKLRGLAISAYTHTLYDLYLIL